jgi:cyclic pyranopterin phosphate synthase
MCATTCYSAETAATIELKVMGLGGLAKRLPLWSDGAPAATAAAAAAAPPRSVRVSLTDRCDLACLYCRPSRNDGYLESRLDEASWRAMLEGLAQAGVRRIRFTGGEPLLYRPLELVIAHAVRLGFEDVALTTNATRLAARAAALRAAGLQRITISLDSLDPARFARLTRGGRLAEVRAGLDAALAAGFDEVKLNTVVLRGENDDELADIARFAWARGVVPRFLEVMPVGEGARLVPERLVTVREMRERLGELIDAPAATPDPDRGPARYARARHDARLRVGFISGTSDTFCAGCDRLRVAADGFVRPCLSKNDGTSGRLAAEAGDARAIAAAVGRAWALKPDGLVWKGCTEETARAVSMRAVGG